MIPRNIELPDEVIRELTSNQILLRWLSEIQKQLITGCVDENGIGCTRLVRNDTGAIISGDAETDAGGLTVMYFNAAGALTASSVTIDGVWINVQGGDIGIGETKMMARLS